MAPLVVNTLAEIMALFPLAFIPSTSFLAYFFGWLAISFGMHAIPSAGDAKALWSYSKNRWRFEKKALLGFPIAAIIYGLSLAKVIWMDLFYALGIKFALNSVFRIF